MIVSREISKVARPLRLRVRSRRLETDLGLGLVLPGGGITMITNVALYGEDRDQLDLYIVYQSSVHHDQYPPTRLFQRTKPTSTEIIRSNFLKILDFALALWAQRYTKTPFFVVECSHLHVKYKTNLRSTRAKDIDSITSALELIRSYQYNAELDRGKPKRIR